MSFYDYLSPGDPGSLHGNLPDGMSFPNSTMAYTQQMFHGQAMPATSDRGGGRSGHFNRRTEPLLDNGSLNKQSYRFGDNTYYFAPRPSIDAAREIKARVYDDAVHELDNGPGSHKNKLTALVTHFQMQAISETAKSSVGAAKVYTSACFNWTYRNLLGSDFAILADPVAGTVSPDACYIAFDLTVDPSSLFPPNLSDVPSATTKSGIRVQLMREPTNVAIIANSYSTIDIRDFGTMYAATQRKPVVGLRHSADNPFAVDKFKTFVDDKFFECAFKIAVIALRSAYVGTGGITTATTRLQQLKQTSVVNGRSTTSSVSSFFERFQNILNEFDTERPYGILTNTFFHNLAEPIKDHLSNQGYLPDTNALSNSDEMGRLLGLKDMATRAEASLKLSVDTAIAVFKRGGGNKSTGVQALMSAPGGYSGMIGSIGNGNTQGNAYGSIFGTSATDHVISPFPSFDHNGNSNNGANYATYPAIGTPNTPGVMSFAAPVGSPGNTALANAFLSRPDSGDDYVAAYLEAGERFEQVTAFLSSAETALRQASGARQPMECWGCTNDSRFHESRFHRFLNCPNKEDPQVRGRGNEALKRLYGDRKNRKRDTGAMLAEGLSPTEIRDNWQKHGFKSKAQALMISALVARNMPNRQRKRFVIQEQHEVPATPSPPTTPDTNRSPVLISYPMVDAAVLQAAPASIQLSLDVTRYLPHFDLPVGTDGALFKIKTACDSCAGVNIGSLAFHLGIAKLYPAAVISLRDLRPDNLEIHIGGVGNGNGIVITHEIVYRMPVSLAGFEARIAFGLSDTAAATALTGISFLKKTRSILSFSTPDEPTLMLQALNLTVPVSFEQPSVRAAPMRHDQTSIYVAHKPPPTDVDTSIGPTTERNDDIVPGHYGPAV